MLKHRLAAWERELETNEFGLQSVANKVINDLREMLDKLSGHNGETVES